MQAWSIERTGAITDLRLGELPAVVAEPTQIIVRVAAAAANPADLRVMNNTGGGAFLHARKFPLIPGFDVSGTVAEVGSALTGWEQGEAVFGFLPYSSKTTGGTFAELVAMSPGWVARKPEKVSHEEAAAVGTVGITALQGLVDKAGVGSGHKVLINGASGGVGSYAVQIARLLGAEVWGTSSASNMALVESLGAKAIDYRATRLRDLNASFDMIFDTAATSSFGECIGILKPGGTYLTTLPTLSFVLGKLRSLVSSRAWRFIQVVPRTADLSRLAGWIESGALSVRIGSTHPFADVPAALTEMQTGRTQGKIVVRMDSPVPI